MHTAQDIIYRLALILPGFLIAMTFHEFAHGWMAKKFGDTTAESQGRLTLDPLAHIDLLGTIIVPTIAIASGLMMFGWAKPVPINPSRFTSIKKGIFWVSFAGPLSNMLLGVIGAIVFALVLTFVPSSSTFQKPVLEISNYFILINILLAFFNLIPLPPLDGSKMLSVILPTNLSYKYLQLERYSSLIFWGVILLSYTGVNIFERIFYPVYVITALLKAVFVQLIN